MIFALYRLIGAPLMVFAFFLVAPFNRKVRSVFAEKLRRRHPPGFLTEPIWIHAASGEFEYAKPVIREIKKQNPTQPILVTYSSATFVSSIESFPGVDFSLALPIDLPGPCRSFLHKYKPKCLLIARTDLWPEIIYQTNSKKIPIVLFSYTQRAPVLMGWLARKTRAWLLKQMAQIQCVSEKDAEHVRELGVVKGVTVSGDTRYDQVEHRLSHPKALPQQLRPTRPTLVAGSTWSADEDVLFSALTPALKDKRLQCILVPHEPTPSHVRELEKRLEKLDLKFKKFSEEQNWADADVLLVDKTGVLAELYQWADFAFVGGSFKGSVHSVMEPLGAGCLTLVGPHFLNNREATEFAKIPAGAFTAVQVCSDAASLKRTVELLLSGQKEQRAQEILKIFNERLGASRTLSAQILHYKPERPAYSPDVPNSSLRN